MRHRNPKRRGHSIKVLASTSSQENESISEFCEDYTKLYYDLWSCSLIIIACLHTWQVRTIEAALSMYGLEVVNPTLPPCMHMAMDGWG